MNLIKYVLIFISILCANSAFSQANYLKAMSKVETEEDVKKLKKKHPKWDISIVELQPIDSVNRPELYRMVPPNISSFGSEGKAYKVLEEKRKLLLIQFKPTEVKKKKKYDY